MAFPGGEEGRAKKSTEEGELRLIRLCTGEKRTIQINICHAKKETEKKRRQQLQRQRTKKNQKKKNIFIRLRIISISTKS